MGFQSMLDNQLIPLVIRIIESGAAGAGIPDLLVMAAFQPTRQGIATPPTAYISKTGDKRYGFPYQPYTWDNTVKSSFTASILGNVLTVTNVSVGMVAIGQTLRGDGLDDGSLWVSGLGTGLGGNGTYILSQSVTPQISSQSYDGIGGLKNMTTQQYETTFQIMTLATQNASTPNQYTASDILNAIAYILQNDSTIQTLEAQGIGILRIIDIRNPPFIDDRDRYEYGPSFDFTLTHKQIITSQAPILQSEEVDIYSV